MRHRAKGIRCIGRTFRESSQKDWINVVYESPIDTLSFNRVIDVERFQYVNCGLMQELAWAKFICWPADAVAGYYDVGWYSVQGDPCYSDEYWLIEEYGPYTVMQCNEYYSDCCYGGKVLGSDTSRGLVVVNGILFLVCSEDASLSGVQDFCLNGAQDVCGEYFLTVEGGSVNIVKDGEEIASFYDDVYKASLWMHQDTAYVMYQTTFGEVKLAKYPGGRPDSLQADTAGLWCSPGKGRLRLLGKNLISALLVRIYSPRGNLVWAGKIGPGSEELAIRLEPGIYFVRVGSKKFKAVVY